MADNTALISIITGICSLFVGSLASYMKLKKDQNDILNKIISQMETMNEQFKRLKNELSDCNEELQSIHNNKNSPIPQSPLDQNVRHSFNDVLHVTPSNTPPIIRSSLELPRTETQINISSITNLNQEKK